MSENILKKLAAKLSGEQKQSAVELEQNLDEVLSDHFDTISAGEPHYSIHDDLHGSSP